MRASAVAHLCSELRAMRILVAVGAEAIPHMQIESRVRLAVAATASRGFMSTLERERRLAVHLHAERCRLKAMLGVTRSAFAAVASGEFTAMRILVAAIAPIEGEPAIAPILWDAWIVAPGTRDFFVFAAQGERRHAVCTKCDGSRHAEPSNGRVAVVAVGAESSLMHRVVAARASVSGARRFVGSTIVADRARDVGMSAREGEARMVGARHGDVGPTDFVVAARALVAEIRLMRIVVAARAVRERNAAVASRRSVALGACDACVRPMKREARLVVIDVREIGLVPVLFVVTGLARAPESILVRIFVARGARAIRSQVRRRAAFVATVVALAALLRRVRAVERPTRFVVIEALNASARPTRQSCVASTMLNVALRTRPASVGCAVKSRACANRGRDVGVALIAQGVIDLTARRVTARAVLVAFEVRVPACEVAGRHHLSACLLRGGQHHAQRRKDAEHNDRCDPKPRHWLKIHQ